MLQSRWLMSLSYFFVSVVKYTLEPLTDQKQTKIKTGSEEEEKKKRSYEYHLARICECEMPFGQRGKIYAKKIVDIDEEVVVVVAAISLLLLLL